MKQVQGLVMVSKMHLKISQEKLLKIWTQRQQRKQLIMEEVNKLILVQSNNNKLHNLIWIKKTRVLLKRRRDVHADIIVAIIQLYYNNSRVYNILF